MSARCLFSRLLAQSALPKTTRTMTPLVRPTLAATRVPIAFTKYRFIHSSPNDYNGIQSAAYHFKRQKHMPYFLEYLMWVVFGSEALHLIWLKMDYKEYKEKVQHKIKLLNDIIKRVENGEMIDDSLKEEIKMVLISNKFTSDENEDIDDEYLNQLIVSSEQSSTTQLNNESATDNVNKPVEDSKWVNVKDLEEAAVEDAEQKEKKKQPFFL